MDQTFTPNAEPTTVFNNDFLYYHTTSNITDLNITDTGHFSTTAVNRAFNKSSYIVCPLFGLIAAIGNFMTIWLCSNIKNYEHQLMF